MKLGDRLRGLIAVGASVTANCQPCLEINAARALENGADEQDVSEAIEVGKLVRQGASFQNGRVRIQPERAGLYHCKTLEERLRMRLTVRHDCER